MRLNLAGRGILVIFPLNLAGGVFPLCWWQWITEGSWESSSQQLLAAGSPPALGSPSLFGHPKVAGRSQTSQSTISTGKGQTPASIHGVGDPGEGSGVSIPAWGRPERDPLVPPHPCSCSIPSAPGSQPRSPGQAQPELLSRAPQSHPPLLLPPPPRSASG